MADNVLKATINVTAPGVQQTFQQVASGAEGTAKSLSVLQKQVIAFGGGVKVFTSNISTAAVSLNQLPAAISKSTSALAKLPGSANQSTIALTNLGRVVQDAPFGFLGIANNINPLLESFQRLKTTTGTTGGALKALGSSLLGAGGLGLAVSFLSTGLILFGDRLFGIGKKAKAAEDSLNSLASKIADQAAQLTTLVGVVQNVNSKYDDKQKALQAINQEYEQYLKALDIEKVTAENVAIAYERIVDAMLRQAVVKGIQDQISAAVEGTAKKMIELQVAQEKVRIAEENRQKTAAQEDSVKQAQGFKNLSQAIDNYSKGATDGVIAQQQFNVEQTKSISNANEFESRLAGLKSQLLQTLAPLLNLTTNFEDLGIKLNDNKKKVKDAAFEYDALKAIFKDLLGIQAQFSRQLQQAQKIRIDTELNIKGIKIPDVPKTDIDRLRDQLERGIKNKPVDVTFEVKQDQEGLENFRRSIIRFNEQLQDSIIGTAEGIAEAFGGVVTGQQNIGRVLIATIADLIAQIGKALIAYGVAKTGIDKILQNPLIPGGFAIGLGLAAIAAASLLKSVSGRALGGPVKKGQPYIVGEAGRELFIPDTGGRIISNAQLNTSSGGRITSGGMAVQVAGQLLLRGNDLIAAISNATRSQSRLS